MLFHGADLTKPWWQDTPSLCFRPNGALQPPDGVNTYTSQAAGRRFRLYTFLFKIVIGLRIELLVLTLGRIDSLLVLFHLTDLVFRDGTRRS